MIGFHDVLILSEGAAEIEMKKLASIILSLALVFLCTGPAFPADRGNTTIQSFSKAKKILLMQVYKDHRTTFYCGCPFNAKKQILPCDSYTPKRDNKRAHRLEWEHIVPAHALVKVSRNGVMATLIV